MLKIFLILITCFSTLSAMDVVSPEERLAALEAAVERSQDEQKSRGEALHKIRNEHEITKRLLEHAERNLNEVKKSVSYEEIVRLKKKLAELNEQVAQFEQRCNEQGRRTQEIEASRDDLWRQINAANTRANNAKATGFWKGAALAAGAFALGWFLSSNNSDNNDSKNPTYHDSAM